MAENVHPWLLLDIPYDVMLNEHGAFLVFLYILLLKHSNIQKSLKNFAVKTNIPFSPINILLY